MAAIGRGNHPIWGGRPLKQNSGIDSVKSGSLQTQSWESAFSLSSSGGAKKKKSLSLSFGFNGTSARLRLRCAKHGTLVYAILKKKIRLKVVKY